jgi:enoyl-CoA hydratase
VAQHVTDQVVGDELVADDVRTSARGGIGRITLDRPTAMNALTLRMVRRVDRILDAWERDPAVQVVLIDGVGDRGLCAGGDLKMFRASALGDGRDARAFWRAEYRMNARIAAYPKPVVALMFGLVLGGGVGISAHARHRIVTDGSSVGMPEVGIGFIPDVGGTWLLAAAPDRLGYYLGLTGLPVGPGDAILCGLADSYVPATSLSEIRSATAAQALLSSVASLAEPTPAGELTRMRHWIVECFSAATAAAIVRRLREHGDPQAAVTADVIETRSPEAVELTRHAMRRSAELDSLQSALDMEFALSAASLDRADFVEGIRAQVIDKDRAPRWRPSTLDQLDTDQVAAQFTAYLHQTK